MTKIIFLVNAYGPNNDNQAALLYDNLTDNLKNKGLAYEDKIIMGDDFNCPINPLLDKQGRILVARQKIVDCIEEIQEVLNLHDVWHVKNP